MATSRTTRQASSASSTTASSRPKRGRSSEQKRLPSKRTKHRTSSVSAYTRSLTAVIRGVTELKHKLISEAPSDEILDDFFERVSCEPAFCFELLSGPKWLCEAIARACEEILDKPKGESTVYLVTVPEHDLIHGSVVIGAYTGTAVFFEDIRLGAVGLFHEQRSNQPVFVRLVVNDKSRAPEPPN